MELNGVNLTNGQYFSGATSSTLGVNYALLAPCQAENFRSWLQRSRVCDQRYREFDGYCAVFCLLSRHEPRNRCPPGPVDALAADSSDLQALTSLTACGQHITNLSDWNTPRV